MPIDELRYRQLNDQPLDSDGDYVLYWMVAQRRLRWNFALQRAIELAEECGKPLLILEAVRSDYGWASDRMHRFILQGMVANRAQAAGSKAGYYAYVEPEPGAGSGLLAKFAKRACAIVSDDFPCFFIPRMLSLTARRTPVLFEAVDSNGLLPMRAADRVFPTAYAFRRFLQKQLPDFMLDFPAADPLEELDLPEFDRLPRGIRKEWPEFKADEDQQIDELLQSLPIDHSVGRAVMDGGAAAAEETLETFLNDRLARYADDRNQPDEEVASGLSPYLHFGHISAHEVFARIIQRENWMPSQLASHSKGSREGWWGMSREAESFLDELITWRELGFNMCWQQSDYDQYESLPEWARTTMEEHQDDDRPHQYSLEEFDAAETHDELWNAAQNQLVTEGRMHNYLRMLWGKKIFEWSASPRDALKTMIQLNNRYAVDGRDPNSYSGIFWCLGRYDRAWGPERPIFGKIRYMSSDNTARKLKVKPYLKRYGDRELRQQQLWD